MIFPPYATQAIAATETGHMTSSVPADYHSLLHASIWIIPQNTDATFECNIVAEFAKAGELYNFEHFSIAYTGGNAWTIVDRQVYMHDLTYLMIGPAPNFTGCKAGQVFGVSLESLAGNVDIHLIGLRFKYRINYPVQGELSPYREEFYTCEKAIAQV